MRPQSIEKIISSPHIHADNTVGLVMRKVLIALLPGILFSIYYFGPGVLVHCILAVVFALLCESLVLKLRKQPIAPALKDGTAMVTAVLFALTISPFTSWWVACAGIAFAIIVSKQLFGGAGRNPFNPAMAGYVFVLLCFPVEMAHWPDLSGFAAQELSAGRKIGFIFSGMPAEPDGISGATPLSNMKLELGLMTMVSEIKSGPLYGTVGGKGWEWIAFAYLIGGIFLIINKVIRWQIPVAVLGSIVVLSMFFNIVNGDIYPSTFFYLFSGSTILCAFFIATDPASSSTTPLGKIIYGVGVGFFIYIIRTWGSYPDGTAFSILIMNALVPLIDHYTRPRVMGEK